MADKAFTAQEIKRQASRLREQTERFQANSSNIIMDIDQIIVQVQEEDSNLRKQLAEMNSGYIELTKTQFKEKLNHIADLMEQWANRTVTNEQETAAVVETAKSDLEFITSLLNQLKK